MAEAERSGEPGCDHRDERGSTVMQANGDRWECIVCGQRFRLIPSEATPPDTDPPREYDPCEMTHAKGTTHYHPLRVSARIKAFEKGRATSPDTDPSGLGDVEAALEAYEREWLDATPPSGHPLIHGIFQRLPQRLAAIHESRAGGEWTAEQHREDAKLVQSAMQRVAERRLAQNGKDSRGLPFVPIEDASDLLMALHRDGLYRPESRAGGGLDVRAEDENAFGEWGPHGRPSPEEVAAWRRSILSRRRAGGGLAIDVERLDTALREVWARPPDWLVDPDLQPGMFARADLAWRQLAERIAAAYSGSGS